MTVIMSCYNQEKFVSQAIESVLSQKTNFDFQLIITDDHSTLDNSVQIIQTYCAKYPEKIKAIFSGENKGYLVNVLRAKAVTKTKYFCLLDADDYWIDNFKLQKAFDFLETNPDYVIYSTNTLRLYENGETSPFITTDIQEKTFTLDDYFNDSIVISQTTGTVFRNVIFKNGIPDIIKDSVGTPAERSFEGDFDRFILHLKYGKAKFINHIDGVYRILSGGIWSRLSTLEQYVIEARARLDYDQYFDYKYHDFFLAKSAYLMKLALLELKGALERGEEIDIEQHSAINFFYVLSKVSGAFIDNKPSQTVNAEEKRFLFFKLVFDMFKKIHF